MDGKTRRTRFEERVEIEREFLSQINEIFGAKAPLAGMTHDAIIAWQAKAGQNFDETWIEKIATVLREASTKAMLLADNSKDVFEPAARSRPSSLSVLSRMLGEVLRE